MVRKQLNLNLTDLTSNDLTDLANLIRFFISILLHTVGKFGMHGVLHILTY